MTPHRITSVFNQLDMVGTVHGDFFRCGSASGPLAPQFIDNGPITKGDKLTLAYNYGLNEYANRSGGWRCRVVRVNTKTITVEAHSDDEHAAPTSGRTFRIEYT